MILDPKILMLLGRIAANVGITPKEFAELTSDAIGDYAEGSHELVVTQPMTRAPALH